MKQYLCFDIGGNSGRAIIAHYDGKSIVTEDLHRYTSSPVRITDGYYYDILSTVSNMKSAIVQAKSKYPNLKSMGIDAFGVDFGLLSKTGELIANPMCDCDSRMTGIMDHVKQTHSIESIYSRVGGEAYEMSTFFQLLALKRQNNPIIDIADKLLMYPDLINYFFTGVMASEYSVATTSSMINVETGDWDLEMVNQFGLPDYIFSDIRLAGQKLAPLSQAMRSELMIGELDVVSVAQHDTASAIAPIPTTDKEFLFISSGTWSVVGAKTEKPVINMDYASEFANEGCYDGSNRLIKNLFGLKFLQECKVAWQRKGQEIDYPEMGMLSEKCEPFKCFIDPESISDFIGTNMPILIQQYCVKTGQKVPESIGEIAKCINESLALAYKKTVTMLEDATNKTFDKIYIVGGGVLNKQLCQMTANATGKIIIASCQESAALGNALVQVIADEKIGKSEITRLIGNSTDIETYEPSKTNEWQQAYEDYLKVTQ